MEKLNNIDLDATSLVSIDPIAVRLHRPVERQVCERSQPHDARDLDPAALLLLDPLAVRHRQPRERQERRRPEVSWLPSYAANALPGSVLLVPVLAVMVVLLSRVL